MTYRILELDASNPHHQAQESAFASKKGYHRTYPCLSNRIGTVQVGTVRLLSRSISKLTRWHIGGARDEVNFTPMDMCDVCI